MFFCFKQKTAYEMRISDWSSDVCSADLVGNRHPETVGAKLMIFADLAQRLADAGCPPPFGHQLRANCVPVTRSAGRMIDFAIAEGKCTVGDRLAGPGAAPAKLDVAHLLRIE